MDYLPLQYFLRHTRIIQLRWCFCPWNHLSVQDVPKMDLVNLWYFRCRSPGRTWSLLERWYFMSSLVIIKTRRIKNLIGCTNIKILEKIPREICFVKWHYYILTMCCKKYQKFRYATTITSFRLLCLWFLIRKAIWYLLNWRILNIHATYSYFFFQSTKLRQPTEGRDSCLKMKFPALKFRQI